MSHIKFGCYDHSRETKTEQASRRENTIGELIYTNIGYSELRLDHWGRRRGESNWNLDIVSRKRARANYYNPLTV